MSRWHDFAHLHLSTCTKAPTLPTCLDLLCQVKAQKRERKQMRRSSHTMSTNCAKLKTCKKCFEGVYSKRCTQTSGVSNKLNSSIVAAGLRFGSRVLLLSTVTAATVTYRFVLNCVSHRGEHTSTFATMWTDGCAGGICPKTDEVPRRHLERELLVMLSTPCTIHWHQTTIGQKRANQFVVN